mgnify:CR=1 FL=1
MVLLAMMAAMVLLSILFYRAERTKRKNSTFISGYGTQNKQAGVLDTLPDGIIIADSAQINYLNQEAWKLLGC